MPLINLEKHRELLKMDASKAVKMSYVMAIS